MVTSGFWLALDRREGATAMAAQQIIVTVSRLTARQAAAKVIAAIKQASKGTLPLSKVSKFDNGIK